MARDEAIAAMPSVGRIWAGPCPRRTTELLLTNFHGSEVDNHFGRHSAFVHGVANPRQQNLSADSG